MNDGVIKMLKAKCRAIQEKNQSLRNSVLDLLRLWVHERYQAETQDPVKYLNDMIDKGNLDKYKLPAIVVIATGTIQAPAAPPAGDGNG